MITQNDCILLLTELQDKGIDVDKYLEKALVSTEINFDILKFLQQNNSLDIVNFYEKLRKSHNNKRSNLYINIVKSDEIELSNPDDILTTLSAMLTQILLFSKNAKDRILFLRHARAFEISKVLTNYFKDYNLIACTKLLRLIKCDLKALESLYK